MAKKRKKLTANFPSDMVECEIVFDNDGIQLNTIEHPGQPDLDQVLDNISRKTRPKTKESLKRAAKELRKAAAALKARSRVALLRNPSASKIKVRKDRVTQLIFYSRSVKWLFADPGFSLDSPLSPIIGTFDVPQIIQGGQTVSTNFTPNHPTATTQIEYTLQLITAISNGGVSDGYAIITVDPIIETSKR